jgi:hypothetical protein
LISASFDAFSFAWIPFFSDCSQVSLSVTWDEHEDALRVNDSLGDEVEAYFGADAEILLNHRGFGESFQVQCGILTDFEHSDSEITSWTYGTYHLPLKHVLELLALRRRILNSVSQKIEQRLATAVRRILEPTKLSALSADFLDGELEEAIMIHYLHYVLARFDANRRIDRNFYHDGLSGFEEYVLTPKVA